MAQWRAVEVLEVDGQAPRVEVRLAQPHRRLLREAVQHREGVLGVAVVRAQHARVRDRVGVALALVLLLAADAVVHDVAADAAPDRVQLVLRARREVAHRADAVARAGASPSACPTPESARTGRSKRRSGSSAFWIITRPSGFTMSEAVLAMKVLGPMPMEVRRHSPICRVEAGLHLPRDVHRPVRLAPAPGELAIHLVDREHRAHRHERIDHGDRAMVIVDVELVARDDELDPGAQLLRVAHLGAGLHAELSSPRCSRRCTPWCRPSSAPRPGACRAAAAPTCCSTEAK